MWLQICYEETEERATIWYKGKKNILWRTPLNSWCVSGEGFDDYILAEHTNKLCGNQPYSSALAKALEVLV